MNHLLTVVQHTSISTRRGSSHIRRLTDESIKVGYDGCANSRDINLSTLCPQIKTGRPLAFCVEAGPWVPPRELGDMLELVVANEISFTFGKKGDKKGDKKKNSQRKVKQQNLLPMSAFLRRLLSEVKRMHFLLWSNPRIIKRAQLFAGRRRFNSLTESVYVEGLFFQERYAIVSTIDVHGI